MTDRDAFIRAICETPADDTPRLVYADWLDEHGEPDRAEFIRVQLALSRLSRVAPVLRPHSAEVIPQPHDPLHDTAAKLQRVQPPTLMVTVHFGDALNVTPGDEVDISADQYGLTLTGARVERVRLFGPGYDPIIEVTPGAFPDPDRDTRAALARRERELLDSPSGTRIGTDPLSFAIVNRVAWFGTLDEAARFQPVYRRGFVTELSCTSFDFTAHAVGLFLRHPITEAQLYDRRPHQNGAGYAWYNPERERPRATVPPAAVVPAPIFDALRGHIEGRGGGRWKAYGSAAAATSALCRASVAHARERAKLSLLPVAAAG